MKNLKELYTEALAMQNACNLHGLSKRFNEMLLDLKTCLENDAEYSTEIINSHPVVTLWLDKFNSLNHIQFDVSKITAAYDMAFKISKEGL